MTTFRLRKFTPRYHLERSEGSGLFACDADTDAVSQNRDPSLRFGMTVHEGSVISVVPRFVPDDDRRVPQRSISGRRVEGEF